jgi:hypothetical protein
MVWVTLLVGCGERPDPTAEPAATDVTEAPPPPVDSIRRLSATWYDHSVADLFPGATIPPQGLPADPEVHGFDNAAEAQVPSALVVEAWLGAAGRVAAAAWAEPAWLPCPTDGGPDPQGCAADFVTDFGRRAFRRPLAPDERDQLLGLFTDVYDADGDFGAAVQVVIAAVLMSPEFLFLPELPPPGGGGGPGGGGREPLDAFATASRLSYLVWAGPPDDALLDAAERGELDGADALEAQARRMLADPRAQRATDDFHRLWLDADRLDRASPDPATYPAWDADLRESLRAELADTVREVLYARDGTLPGLLLDPVFVGDRDVAQLYGVDPAAAELPPGERAGLLTRAGWLAATSHAVHPSPVQRGRFVLERLLCDPPPPPPPDIDTSAVDDVPDADPRTNRERYEAHATDPVCASCHRSIDGIGMGFEHYDAVGAWRDQDAGLPVDAAAELASGDLDGVRYDGALELSEHLAGSADVHRCYTTEWLRYGLGRTESAGPGGGDEGDLGPLAQAFYEGGGDVNELIVGLVRTEVFRTRAVPAAGDAGGAE